MKVSILYPANGRGNMGGPKESYCSVQSIEEVNGFLHLRRTYTTVMINMAMVRKITVLSAED